MDATIAHALTSDTLIDITTIGKQTGTPRRIEIAFHNIDGVLYITGYPGKRDWYANLLANPQLTVHLKQSTTADLPARAIPITDEATRRQVLAKVVEKWGRHQELEAFVAGSPVVEVQFASS